MEIKNKFDRLNLLRIVAFFMVFLLHAKIFMPVQWDENVSLAWMLYTPAWGAVWIFIVLSGYGIGAGFYSGKYEMSLKGIIKYYYGRLLKILPLYWTYMFIIIVFIRPDYLLLGRESLSKILPLLFFDYREEYDSLYFGLAWYMSTLIKLYAIAPIFYYLTHRYFAKKQFWILRYFFLVFLLLFLRLAMKYHIMLTGDDVWAYEVYKPFYYNLDLFFGGFLLNELKYKKFFFKKIKIVPWIIMGGFILYNSYEYYNASFLGKGTLTYYCYVYPTIYLLLVSFFIINYDIRCNYKIVKLSTDSLKKNIFRIIDYFAKLMMPLYLFHSTILFCMQEGYNESYYLNVSNILHIPDDYKNFSIGCMFTVLSLSVTIFWAIVVHNTVEKDVCNAICKCTNYIYTKYGKYLQILKKQIKDKDNGEK